VGVKACQHVAVRVGDIDRAARFYIEAFGGRRLTLPFEVEGPEMEELFGGHPGLRTRVCLLGFDEGCIELFQFLEPSTPPTAIDPPSNNIIHWCLQVDDVAETLARVESLGGRPVRPLADWGGANFVYCTDLDGNVFELLDSSIADTVGRTLALFPDAAPPS
jgi:catechol 2,3-dioxygenase-like lactoylglutathione lyase family enzyme